MIIPSQNNHPRWATGMGIIQFGSPGKDCLGHGICRIEGAATLIDVPTPNRCTKGVAIVRMLSNQRLRLHVVKTSICKNAWLRYFSKPTLELQEPVEVLMHHWPVKTWEILPGIYTIRESETHFALQVQVVPQGTSTVPCEHPNTQLQISKTPIS